MIKNQFSTRLLVLDDPVKSRCVLYLLQCINNTFTLIFIYVMWRQCSAIYLDLIYEDSNLSRCPDLAFPNHPLHLIPSQLRHIISPACTWALAGRTVCEPAYLEAIQEICLLDATLTGIQQLMISVTTKSLWQ